MVAHNELSDTKVRRETTAPSAAPNFVGEIYIEDNAVASSGKCVRVAADTDSSSDFVVVAFIPQSYNGDPNGLVQSRCDLDLCIDVLNHVLFYSRYGGSNDWQALSGGAGGGGS